MASQSVVGLNVGGMRYLTTRSTLTSCGSSMLGALVEGSVPSYQDKEGNYFIDRDGSLFQYILNFLRSGTLALPKDFNQHEQLALEADFYQIQPLVDAIHQAQRALAIVPLRGQTIEVEECLKVSPYVHSWDRVNHRNYMDRSRGKWKYTRLMGQHSVLLKLQSEYEALRRMQIGGTVLYGHVNDETEGIRISLAGYLQSNGWQRQDFHQSVVKDGEIDFEIVYHESWFLQRDI